MGIRSRNLALIHNRSCRDVDAFVDCWQEMKVLAFPTPDPNSTVHTSAYLFPVPDDLKRAYHIFCARSFLNVMHDLVNMPGQQTCDYEAMLTKCSAQSDQAEVMKRMLAHRESDPNLFKYYSCNIWSMVNLCVRNMTEQSCSPTWQNIIDLEMVKLGP
ncbi:hypothetical protein PoB_004723000 [Plakobranchus ocellatus]|uniref:Uncharacterized protein n=1 Tax=Plakobranchus ocellatus TaxID=259542 RepID=A0AAV4BJN0_9GAST|nr:hypothetical protein PoB_004723000 [Plakobranchus ocellatus]